MQKYEPLPKAVLDLTPGPAQGYSHILFNFTGCIAQTQEIWTNTYDDVLRSEATPPIEKSREELIASNGHFLARITEWTHSSEEARRLVDIAHARVGEQLQDFDLEAEIIETVHALGEMGTKMAVVTKSKSPVARHILQRNGIAKYFEAIVGGNDVEQCEQQPHPASVNLALKQLGNPVRRNVVMMGDSADPIQAAHSAGINAVLYHPPANKPYNDIFKLQALNPRYIIRDFRGILAIAEHGRPEAA